MAQVTATVTRAWATPQADIPDADLGAVQEESGGDPGFQPFDLAAIGSAPRHGPLATFDFDAGPTKRRRNRVLRRRGA